MWLFPIGGQSLAWADKRWEGQIFTCNYVFVTKTRGNEIRFEIRRLRKEMVASQLQKTRFIMPQLCNYTNYKKTLFSAFQAIE